MWQRMVSYILVPLIQNISKTQRRAFTTLHGYCMDGRPDGKRGVESPTVAAPSFSNESSLRCSAEPPDCPLSVPSPEFTPGRNRMQ
mmetsp:Transcript_37709/g.69661  ORF Transcript_37709/g.69661 Transcript_37709/m.69661 type:complete len:86 (-) Transcript_37709:298-555(-)